MTKTVLFLLALSASMVHAVDHEKYAKIEDKYASFYVVPAVSEGTPGAGDGRHLMRGSAITEYANGPIEGVDDPTLMKNDIAGQVGVISYSLVVSDDVYKAFIAAGGNDSEIEAFVKTFAYKYELDGLEMKMAFQKVFVDVKRKLRNEFYEGVAAVFARRLPNESQAIQKLMFYRNVQLRSKLTPEQLAAIVK